MYVPLSQPVVCKALCVVTAKPLSVLKFMTTVQFLFICFSLPLSSFSISYSRYQSVIYHHYVLMGVPLAKGNFTTLIQCDIKVEAHSKKQSLLHNVPFHVNTRSVCAPLFVRKGTHTHTQLVRVKFV